MPPVAGPAPRAEPIIQPETAFDAAAAEALVERVFGPGRLAKTAERLREGSEPLAHLSFVAREQGRLVGTVRLWPVTIGEARGAFLGPIAVDPERRDLGLGGRLIEASCAAAEDAGLDFVLLVGDPPYFQRFGFTHAADVRLPGPVDRTRVLVRVLRGGSPSGAVAWG
jgi:predicted N-acetyltransferase YhbS